MIVELDNTGSYFLNVFSNKGLDIGILRIKIGEKDTQLPHSVDEAYFVVKGNGSIEIDGKIKPVKSNDFIFVPANAHHRFIVGNQRSSSDLFLSIIVFVSNNLQCSKTEGCR